MSTIYAVQIRTGLACQREPAFGEMWALVHSEALLTARLAGISHQISDANLQQMPDFHQRVRVLRELGYVAHDDTVAMKAGSLKHLIRHGLARQILAS